MKRLASLATRIASIVSLSVACALPAFAQSTGTSGGGTPGGVSGPSVETRRTTDNDRDYGWIGLLGLLGLLGLRRKHHDHVNTTTTTDTRRPTTTSR